MTVSGRRRHAAAVVLVASLAVTVGSRCRGGDAPGSTPVETATALDRRPGGVAAKNAAAPIRELIVGLAAAGRRGDIDGCRRRLSRGSQALFDTLFRRGERQDETRGWQSVCRAHARLAWPRGAAVQGRGPGAALLAGESDAGRPVRIPLVREQGAWRVDYAVHPLAPALAELP